MQLTAENLCGERGGEAVFAGVSFDLAAGGCMVVTGPNGSGKSTLIRIIAGLLPIAAGSVRFEGGGDWPSLTGALHYLGHQNAMKPALTVAENLRFWQAFSGEPRLSVAAALEAAGLAGIGHLPFGYLSTGQRRRASIAKLLMVHRPVWLLDEPTAGLDAASEEMFAGLAKGHLRNDGMLIAATHQALGVEATTRLDLGAK